MNSLNILELMVDAVWKRYLLTAIFYKIRYKIIDEKIIISKFLFNIGKTKVVDDFLLRKCAIHIAIKNFRHLSKPTYNLKYKKYSLFILSVISMLTNKANNTEFLRFHYKTCKGNYRLVAIYPSKEGPNNLKFVSLNKSGSPKEDIIPLLYDIIENGIKNKKSFSNIVNSIANYNNFYSKKRKRKENDKNSSNKKLKI